MSSNKIIVHTDGASRGNPGLAGAGIVVEGLSQKYALSFFLGNKTNNEAEYLAVLFALRLLNKLISEEAERKLLISSKVCFKMDSKLVVEQLIGNWKVKNVRMKKFVDECKIQVESLGFPILFEHVDRELNKQADWLANEAIDLAS
ncbi:MAG: Ribonuclease H [Microgenomates bacterium 39_7]|nr:MAG: Ribonuclease H [Microgenomates bacterium 39_7]